MWKQPLSRKNFEIDVCGNIYYGLEKTINEVRINPIKQLNQFGLGGSHHLGSGLASWRRSLASNEGVPLEQMVGGD